MELILVKYVRNLGKIGDIVTVKDGFGRNYLIPQQLAIVATTANKSVFEEQKVSLEARNLDSINKAKNLSCLLLDTELIFVKQAADDGRLFGSVNKKEIAGALSKIISNESDVLDGMIGDSSIILNTQIKSTGIHSVTVELHPEIHVPIIVVVAKSESEALNALSAYKGSKSADVQSEADDI